MADRIRGDQIQIQGGVCYSFRVKNQFPPPLLTFGWAGGSSVSVATNVPSTGAVSSSAVLDYYHFTGRIGLIPGFLGNGSTTGLVLSWGKFSGLKMIMSRTDQSP